MLTIDQAPVTAHGRHRQPSALDAPTVAFAAPSEPTPLWWRHTPREAPEPEPRWWHTPHAEAEPQREDETGNGDEPTPESMPRNARVLLAVGSACLLLVVLAIAVVQAHSGSTAGTYTPPPPPTTTPLGCATHPVDNSGDVAVTVPWCTERALASRYCALNLTAAPDETGSSFYWPGGSTGYVRETVYGGAAVGSGGNIFQCANYARGLSRAVTFSDLQWDLLMTPGPDDQALETMLGPAHS